MSELSQKIIRETAKENPASKNALEAQTPSRGGVTPAMSVDAPLLFGSLEGRAAETSAERRLDSGAPWMDAERRPLQTLQQKRATASSEALGLATSASVPTETKGLDAEPASRLPTARPVEWSGAESEPHQPLQRKARTQAQGGPPPDAIPTHGGEGLPTPVRKKMESAFGTDLGDVRIHQGAQAEAMGALAFTQGSNIHFAPGQYALGSEAGQALLGHELTHVVQQRAGRVTVPQGKGLPVNTDASLEAEADQLGAKAARGEPALGSGVTAQGPNVASGGEVMQASPTQSGGVLQAKEGEDEGEGKSLKEKLNTALGGWSQDSKAILDMIATASEKDKAEVLEDTALLTKLKGVLSKTDQMIAFQHLKAPIKERISIAMSGWGTDAQAILDMTSTASESEKETLLKDSAFVELLKTKLNREEAIIVLTHLKAPLKDRINAAMQGWGADGAAIKDMLSKAKTDEKQGVTKDRPLLERLCSELSAQDRADVLDLLFVEAVDAPDLQFLFEKRFAIALSSGNDTVLLQLAGGTDAGWGPEGLKRLYPLFKSLPPSHVEKLKVLVSTSKSKGHKAASGGSIHKHSLIKVAYDDSMTGESESGDYTDKGDLMQGINILDTTVAHELGHQVDAGGKYSASSEFMELSNWTTHARGEEAKEAIISNLTNPFGFGLGNTEKEIANEAASLAIANRRASLDAISPDVNQIYDRKGYYHTGKKTFDPFSNAPTYRPSGELSAALKNVNLFKHIVSAHVDQEPWMTEPLPNTKSRQVHEAYAWKDTWFSYPTSARDSKFSRYQLRDPSEEFAELYATYHSTTPKGSKVPNAHKTWFEAQGLHK